MFVIVVYPSLEEYRNGRLNQVLGDFATKNKKYLRKDGRKFYETSSLSWCECWKTSTAPTKIVNEFNSQTNKGDYRSKFSSVWGGHLVVEKLTRDEWNSIIDQKIGGVKNRMNKQIQDLEKERGEYKYN